jgi:DNA-binding Lrp family transcriptional regulator
VVLDDVSRAIIEQLQQDGRRPYARIAEAVGLSEAAVRQRVQRLLDAGVVQIVGVTDPMQVGFARQAMVGIRTRGDTRKVADAFAAFDVSTSSSSPPAPSTSWSRSSARTTTGCSRRSAACATSRASSRPRRSCTWACASRPTPGGRAARSCRRPARRSEASRLSVRHHVLE